MTVRSAISAIPLEHLRDIQIGTMSYRWKGVLCLKNPFDIALYQMLLWQVKPATLIEIGSNEGGSAYWFADMLEVMGVKTRIISIDIKKPDNFSDPRIDFRVGDGCNLAETLSDEEMASLPRPLLVIEDASHDYELSLAALQFFDKWLDIGEYYCVEDGIIETFHVEDRHNGGPTRAIREFLAERGDDYVIDEHYCDFFGVNVTWNTNGFLKRVRGRANNIASSGDQNETRYGDKRAEITRCEIRDDGGQAVKTLSPRKSYTLALQISPKVDVPETVIGFIIRDAKGVEVYGADSLQLHPAVTTPLKAGEAIEFCATFRNSLTAGEYWATVALAETDTTKLDVRIDTLRFTVEGEKHDTTDVVDIESLTRYQPL
ncbi:MAG: CmcI family methyltransferase [Pseudomonadota bacterium]